MSINSFRLPFLCALLIVAWLNLFSYQLFAEEWTVNGLIRISSKSQVQLAGIPAYLESPKSDMPVSFMKLKPFDNAKDQSEIRALFKKGSVWIKIEVFNPTSTDQKGILRLYEHCQDFSIYYHDGRQFRHYEIGAIHRKRPIPESYYDAAPLLLPPGYTSLYLHHISSLNKVVLRHIDIVHPI